MQGVEAIDITVDNHILLFSAQLGAYSRSKIVTFALFGHQKKGKGIK